MTIREITNAERAARAEAALLAYIENTGDAVNANGIDTWVADLLCDLRHLADLEKFEFNPNAGMFNYEAEAVEDDMGEPTRAVYWYVEGTPPAPRPRPIIQLIDDLLNELALALPYVETALKDEGYKPGAVAKRVAGIRAAIARAETGGRP